MSGIVGAVEERRVIKININGREYEFEIGVDIQPGTTLFELLRSRVGLRSVRDACLGDGSCGACTVLVDGDPVLSCMMLAADCHNRKVETVEGIAREGHPLIDAFAKNYAYQCGYEAPAFIVTAKALLDKNPNPSEEEIVEALSGIISRAGVYPAVISAVEDAAEALRKRGVS